MTNPIIGIDIAKDKFDCALLNEDQQSRQSFSNTKAGFKRLDLWLKQFKTVHACMEATGYYWKALAEHLHKAGHTASVINPVQIKRYAQSRLSRNKNDTVDALIIAQFCKCHVPPAWMPPSPAQRAIQELTRHLGSRKNDLTRESNRLKGGIQSREIIKEIKSVIKSIKANIKMLQSLIASAIAADPGLAKKAGLLRSIIGVGNCTASVFLAETPDIKNFKHSGQLAAYAGLSPRQNESGSSLRGKTRLCKTGNARLRLSLYFPAIVAMRRNPILKARADRMLAAGKSKMCVIGAIMHHLLLMAYAILKSEKPFDPNFLQTKKA